MFETIKGDDKAAGFYIRWDKDFDSEAITLIPEEVLEGHDQEAGTYTRVHSDGWTIRGEISEDYYYWVSNFKATHPVHGRVWGDFEEGMYADSKEGYEASLVNHSPRRWDYHDI